MQRDWHPGFGERRCRIAGLGVFQRDGRYSTLRRPTARGLYRVGDLGAGGRTLLRKHARMSRWGVRAMQSGINPVLWQRYRTVQFERGVGKRGRMSATNARLQPERPDRELCLPCRKHGVQWHLRE
jgi:hypothetical protein